MSLKVHVLNTQRLPEAEKAQLLEVTYSYSRKPFMVNMVAFTKIDTHHLAVLVELMEGLYVSSGDVKGGVDVKRFLFTCLCLSIDGNCWSSMVKITILRLYLYTYVSHFFLHNHGLIFHPLLKILMERNIVEFTLFLCAVCNCKTAFFG